MKVSYRQRLRYWFDNTMSKGTPALIGWLGVVVLVMVLVGAFAMAFAGPGKITKQGPAEAVWQSLMRVLDPGTVTADIGWPFRLLSLGVTFGGILIFSALIGVLTTGLDAKLEELRKGRSQVLESGHTVILGWSDQVFTIISELAEANSNQRKAAIAILADRDKVEMEDEVRAKVPDTRTTKVVCRTGSPIDPDDIRLVNPDESKSVIVLPSDEDDDPDAHLVKTLLAIINAPDRRAEPYHIVAAVTKPENLAAARLAGGSETHLVDVSDVTARLIVQTCLQSGLSVVHSSLLVYEGDEIYMQQQPELTGWSFGDVLHAYRTSTVLGLLADGKVRLNPPMHSRLRPGDQVIAISEDDDTVLLAPHPPMIDQRAILAVHGQPNAPERTLILGWNERAPIIIRELDGYVTPGSEVQIVSGPPETTRRRSGASSGFGSSGDRDDVGVWLHDLVPRLRNTTLHLKDADPADRAVLEGLDVGRYDHVIALCRDDLEPQLADSRNLVTLLHLRDMERHAGGRFSVVSEMADDRNRALAQVTKADDFVVGEKLISLLMTQISENPRLADVFGDLFDPDGSEIYLKPAGYYVRTGMPVNFYTIVEAARRRGEVAIGYRLVAHSQQPPAYGVVLNPDKAQPIVLSPADRVVVLAED